MRWITVAFAGIEPRGPRAPACLDCGCGVFADPMIVCRISGLIGRAGILFPLPELQPGGGAKSNLTGFQGSWLFCSLRHCGPSSAAPSRIRMAG